jgi:prepilin-type N-terminal cleavage/methylation domain-containing protein
MNFLLNRYTFRPKRLGFTLIEVLVVIGIFAVLAGFAFASFSTSREHLALRDTHATVLFALEESKNNATTGVGTTPHGVYVEEGQVTLFAGEVYGGVGEVVAFPSEVKSNQVGTEIVFSRLAGTSSEATTITLTNNKGETRDISVTYDGNISQ